MPPPLPAFDYYAELEISSSATIPEITASYRRLARQHHPDRNPDDQEAATAKFQRIQQAYETLVSAEGRKRYDSMPKRGTTCTCGRHHDEDYDWETDYEYEDEEDEDEWYYDFAYGGRGPPRTYSSGYSHGGFRFGGFKSYEDMERRFQEMERREAERLKELHEEHRKRQEAEAARKKEKEDAKKAAEREKIQEKDRKRHEERRQQEERWLKTAALTAEEKRVACLHSDFCVKVPQKKKFKCSACGKKGGMMAFECPYCTCFLCQQCVTRFSERRAKGEDIKVETPWESELEDIRDAGKTQPDTENFAETSPTLDEQPPEQNSDENSGFGDGEGGDGGVDIQATKKSKKKKKTKKKTSQTVAAEPGASESQDTRPSLPIRGLQGQNGTKYHAREPVEPVRLNTQPRVNGISPQTSERPYVPNHRRSGSSGIPGLFPFPPPLQKPSEVDEASEYSTTTSSDFTPPSPLAPAQIRALRGDGYVNGYNPPGGRPCYVCGQAGHFARNCTKPMVCQNCGENGHIAKYCGKSSKAHHWRSAQGNPDYRPATRYQVSTTRVGIKGATLARGITLPLLREAMESFGTVTDCHIDRKAGIAWAEFTDYGALCNAITASPVPVAKGAVTISEWRERA